MCVFSCGATGTFPPTNTWPSCAVLSTCPDPPEPDTENSGLQKAADTPALVKAYREVVYACVDAAKVTDEGKEIRLMCQADGTYAHRYGSG